MTSWLIRRFIRTPENTQDQAVRKQYGTLGSTVGMALNLLLSLGKILLGLITASLAVMADGVNNLSDAGGSLISLISVRMAQKPLDEEHPFGHGRENTPAVYAHEILHCFGAVDLYYASDAVPQAYVDHLESTRAFDLMNRCYFSDYDRVTTAFSDVDAYFVGLLDDCGDARKYGLGPNIFQKWGDLAG